jgi:uncharacterized protein with HEPN domain
MKRNPRVYLDDILESIEKIFVYTKKLKATDFYKNDQIQDAVSRRLAIIGEAANSLSQKIKNQDKKIAWRKIIGLRNALIHEYFGINLKWIWKIIKEDLPKLEESVKKIIDSL